MERRWHARGARTSWSEHAVLPPLGLSRRPYQRAASEQCTQEPEDLEASNFLRNTRGKASQQLHPLPLVVEGGVIVIRSHEPGKGYLT